MVRDHDHIIIKYKRSFAPLNGICLTMSVHIDKNDLWMNYPWVFWQIEGLTFTDILSQLLCMYTGQLLLHPPICCLKRRLTEVVSCVLSRSIKKSQELMAVVKTKHDHLHNFMVGQPSIIYLPRRRGVY